jgi:hypothetical protein
MNANTRMVKVREKLREQECKGNLGVMAAKTGCKEGDLYAWLRNPVYAPSADELTRLEIGLGLLPTPQTGDAAADA